MSTERVDDLKRDIALSQYEVDAYAVAEAIVAKLRLVRSGRLALLTGDDAGQNPMASRPQQGH